MSGVRFSYFYVGYGARPHVCPKLLTSAALMPSLFCKTGRQTLRRRAHRLKARWQFPARAIAARPNLPGRDGMSGAIPRHFLACYCITALEHVLDIFPATCYGSFRKKPVLLAKSAE